MDVYTEITKMIVKELAVDEQDVVAEAHLQDDLGADSLALLNLATAISKLYAIQLQGDDMVEIENVGELVSLIESRIGANGA